MEVDKKLKDEIISFCKLNEINDINIFFNKIIETGFNIEKYGNQPILSTRYKVLAEDVVDILVTESSKPTVTIKPEFKQNNQQKDDYEIYD